MSYLNKDGRLKLLIQGIPWAVAPPSESITPLTRTFHNGKLWLFDAAWFGRRGNPPPHKCVPVPMRITLRKDTMIAHERTQIQLVLRSSLLLPPAFLPVLAADLF